MAFALKISYILTILTILVSSRASTIQAVTQTPVRAFSNNQGYITDYTFTIYLNSTIRANAYLEVEFPEPYQLPSECKVYIKIGLASFTEYACSRRSYSQYLINLDRIIPNQYQIVFEGIQNPSISLGNLTFQVKIYLNQTTLVDSNEFFYSASFLSPAETSRNSSIKSINNTGAGQESTYQVNFALKQPLAKGDSIRFNFPEGYRILKPTCLYHNSGVHAQAKVLHNNRSIICQFSHEALAANITQVVSITGVINPKYSGYFENFSLETIEGTSTNVYERIGVSNLVQIVPGKIALNIKSSSPLLALNTTFQFEMEFENDVPAMGEIWIKVPSDFRLLAPNCTLLTPIEASLNRNVITCQLAENKTGYVIRDFKTISANQKVVVSTAAENPSTTADYKIQVLSYSTFHNAIIDEAFGFITVQSPYSLDAVSKSVKKPYFRWNRMLSLNVIGSLEFTFLLNTPLPATTSPSFGKIVVEIRPQITLPPAPKVLKCWLNKVIPAQDCTWDVSNSDKTTVTIMTPTVNVDFQVEVPITVTTEEAGVAYGILLPTLVQGYKFNFYFWKNGDVKEHEVYFDYYVPDPIELANSDVSLIIAPLQYGQEAYLELVWTNTYYALGTNYFIELEFDHSTAGWDYNLGWASLDYYGRHIMPCLVVNLGSDYKCYMNPGGAAGTNSVIQIINLDLIPLSTIVTIRLPKIKLGASGAANIKFTVYENTPGETQLKIPIVFKEFSFTPAAPTSLAPSSSLSISLTIDKPDVDADLTLTFTSDLSDPRYVIYQYPELFTISTQTVPCSSNQCHIFTSADVRWIVFAITNVQGTSASTMLTVHNPPYIGSYTYTAKTEKSSPIGDYRQGSITINSGTLTVSFTTNTANPEINKNSLLIFDIAASSVTRVPKDGSIVLTFSGLTVPDNDDFACEIVSGLTAMSTATGVICEKQSSTKIKIYNFDEVVSAAALKFTVQLWAATATTLNGKIETFYDRAATSTKLIDTGNIDLTLVFANDNFAASSIIHDRSGDIVRADSYGAITLSLTPSYTYSSAKMTISFGAGFTFSTTSDIPYCKLNTDRKRCYVSTYSPLTLYIPDLGSTYLTASTPVKIYITSDYSDPNVKGIKAPNVAGYQQISITLTDTSITPSTDKETNGQFVYVYPKEVPAFTVAGTCTSADSYTIFIVSFSLKQSLNSNTDTTTRGRIYIEFPTGTGNFRDDLGTGLSTGDSIACTVENPSLDTSITCRLVKSPGAGLPAAVELIGFGAISAGTAFKVRIAKIKNVQTTLGENVFGLRVDHLTVATGEITPREYTTYNLWHRVNTLASTPTTYTTAPAVTFGAGSYPNIAGRTMVSQIYSNVALTSTASGPVTDYYIYELPSDFLVSSAVTCPTAIGSSNCYAFPGIGWVVYEIAGGRSINANSNIDGTISTITMPGSYPYSNGYTFKAYIWKNNALDHYMQHTIAQTYIQSTLLGTFPTAGAAASLDINSDQLVKGRQKTEITVSFTTFSAIPSTGTIEIRFPSAVIPLPHCKNAPSAGSTLTSSTGRIACTVQGTSWLVTNFDTVGANKLIKIYGFINLPATASSYTVQLYSYSNQPATAIATTGNPIDRLITGLSFTVQAYNTLNLDSTPSTLINDPIIAKTNNFRPFIFDFTLNGIGLTLANSGVIEITVITSATAFLTTLSTGATRVCTFMEPITGNYIACQVTVTTGSGGVITYSLYPKQDLLANTKYRATITSVFGNDGIDGIQQPSDAGTYQVSIIAREGSVEQRDVAFYEILPDKFKSLVVKNYVISFGDEDAIDISLTVPTAAPIAATNRLVIELPTMFNSTNLFDEDLGLSLTDFQDKLCDIISSDPTLLTMSCFFQKGNRIAKTSASVVLYGFSASFTELRFAFTVKNPTLATPTAIPLTIYTLTGSAPPFPKTYYQNVERAIVVLSSANTPKAATNTNRPTYSTRQVKSTGVTLSFILGTFSNGYVMVGDYYALKVPRMGSSTAAFSTTVTAGGVNANVLVLPKNRFIIVSPSPNSMIGSATVVVPGLVNPEQPLGTGNLAFAGYVAHFGDFTCEKVTFSQPAQDFTAATSFPTPPIITSSSTEVFQSTVLTFTINAVYEAAASLILTIPSWINLKEDCYEAVGNQVPILQCRTDAIARRVYVTLESQTYSSSAMNLKLTVLAQHDSTVGAVTGFAIYIYSTIQTDPTQTTGQLYVVTGINPGITLTTLTGLVAAPTFLEAQYVPYVEYSYNHPPLSYGDLRFKLITPIAITTSHTFKLYIPSILEFDTATTAGDITSSPAVILSDTTAATYVQAPATYSSGVLSFTSPAAIISGRTVKFWVTSMQQTGELIGVRIPSSYSLTNYNVLLEIYSGTSVVQTVQLGPLTLSPAEAFPVTLLPMTKAGGELNAFEFTITSLTDSITDLYIEFPTVDDYENSLWASNLGGFSDKAIVPCSSSSKLPTVDYPDCIFLAGTPSQPAKIWVRSFSQTGTMTLYIATIYNPAAGKRVYMNVRFYAGDTFHSISRVAGYYVETSALTSPTADDTNYYVTGPTSYLGGTFTFRIPATVTIPANSLLLIRTDSLSYCSMGFTSSNQHFLYGPYRYLLMKVTSPITGSYTFDNFRCTKAIALNFLGYHMTGSSTGEKRSMNYVATLTERQQIYGNIALSQTYSAIVSTNMNSVASTYAKFSFDLSPLAPAFTFNGKSLVTSLFRIHIQFQNYYIGTFTTLDNTCLVFAGLGLVSPNSPVSCTVSSGIIVITNFASISTTTNLQFQISFTTAASYTSTTGTAIIQVFSQSGFVPSGDFVSYSTISLAVDNSPPSVGKLVPSFTFPTRPYPGMTAGTVELSSVATSLPASYTTTASNYFRIGIEKGILSSSTICSSLFNAGTYTSCYPSITPAGSKYDYLMIPLSYPTLLTNLPQFKFSFTNTNWPIDARQLFYEFAIVTGTGSYIYCSASMTSTLETSTSVTGGLTLLHKSTNYPTELNFNIQAPIALDSDKIISVQLPYITLPTSVAFTELDCICSVAVRCYLYTPTYIDVIVSSPLPANTNLNCYVPSVMLTNTGSGPQIKIIDASSRAGYFYVSLTVPSTTSVLVLNTHTLGVTYPPAPIMPYQDFPFTASISSTVSYTAGSFAYLDFGAAGPIYSCTGLSLDNCRYYGTVRNIVVIKVSSAQSSGISFNLFSATVTFPYRMSEIPGDYIIASLMINPSTQMITSTGSTPLSQTDFSPEKTAITLTVDEPRAGLFSNQKLSFALMSNALPPFSTTAQIIILIYGLTNTVSGGLCYASSSYKRLSTSWVLSSGSTRFTINSSGGLPAGSIIDLYFTGNNPASGTLTIILMGYSKYNAGDLSKTTRILADGAITVPTYTINTGTFTPLSSILLLTLVTKIIDPPTAPIRVRFKLAQTLSYTSNNGQVILVLPPNEYAWTDTGTNLIAYFRTYKNELDFTQQEAAFVTISGTQSTGYTIVAGTPTLALNTLNELVIMTDRIPASTAYFAKLSADGKQLTATFSYTVASIARLNKDTTNLYMYRGSPFVAISNFYYTSKYASDANSLVLTLNANSDIAAFPTSAIEIELTSASSSLIKSGLTTSGDRQLSCGITVLTKRPASVAAPRCTIVHSSPPKIRIENYDAFSAGTTFNLVIYDLLNTIIPQSFTKYFDAVVMYTDFDTKARSRVKLTRAFTALSGSSGAGTTALTGMTTSVLQYGSASTLTQSILWPATMDCTSCRFIVKSSGSDWKFKEASDFEFKIDGNLQTVILDTVNNAFVVLSATIPLSGSTTYAFTFSGSSFRNPLPSENNANSFTVQYIRDNQYQAAFTMALPYTSLISLGDLTGVSDLCSVVGNKITGAIGGNLACYFDIPVQAPAINTIRIDFPVTAQFSQIYPYCEAYDPSSSATIPGGQLACSRAETVAGSASILVSGFTFATGKKIRVFFRARLLTAALTANIYLQINKNNVFTTLYQQLSYSIGVTSATSSSYATPTLFQVQSFVPTPLAFSTVSPLRIFADIGQALATTDYLRVIFQSEFPVNGPLQCTLRSVTNDFPLPILTKCSYASKTYVMYPLSSVPIGRYMITIATYHNDFVAADGITFPADTTRVPVKVTVINTGSTTSMDLTYLAMIAKPFNVLSISPQRNLIAGTSSQFDINILPSSSSPPTADTATNEVILVLEFPTPLYDPDLGATTVTFSADGIPYYNGVFVPSAMDSAFGANAIATLHYGTSTEPARIVISKHSGFPNTLSTISLGLIKNPAAINSPLRMNIYLISYQTGQAYPTVLYQASYNNYYYTVGSAGETGGASIWRFSSGYVQQPTDIIFENKYYASSVDPSSKIYVKLKSAARGFDYAAMTGISCTGYTVQWHKSGYIFYLIPNANVGTTPTITCTGFRLGTTIETVTIETGCHRDGNTIYKSEQSIALGVLNPIPGLSSSITRITPSLDNPMSVSRYLITVTTGGFMLKNGGYLLLVMPPGLAPILALSEYVLVSGLSTSLQASIISGNLKISGYIDFSGTFALTVFLKNMSPGNQQISLQIYDEKLALAAQTALQAVPVSSLQSVIDGSILSFLTDTSYVFAGERFRLTANLQIKNALSPSTSSQIQVIFPANFQLTPGKEVCKYRLASSTVWIRSTCSVSSQTVTFPIIQLAGAGTSDIPAGSSVYVVWTSEDPDYLQAGVKRALDTTIRHIFNIKTIVSGNPIESVYIPIILYPDPDNLVFTTTWYTQGAGDRSIIEVRFTAPADIPATDFFQLDLTANDEIGQVFANDLGSGSAEKRVISDCAENPGLDTISDNVLINCYIQQGGSTSGSPARIVVYNEKAIIAAGSNEVRFYIANIKNPTGGIPGGFVISVMTPCRNDGYGCPRYRTRGYKSFNADSPKVPSVTSRGSPDSSLNSVLDEDSMTTFTFQLTNAVTSNDAIIVKTNTENIVIKHSCTPAAGTGMCIHFPRIGWTFFQPSSTINAGSGRSISFKIDNGEYYDRTNPQDLNIEAWSNAGIQQKISSPHPDYQPKVPIISTVPTQFVSSNPYIIRNFYNILEISISDVWRTQKVQRIIVNTPASYPKISDYCIAGIDLEDISNVNYIEFPCKVTGDREITIVINDPSRWSTYYAGKLVQVYFKAFLPVDSAIGLTTKSTITSFTDRSLPYVIDENKDYSFTISSTPTPLVRNLCFFDGSCHQCDNDAQCMNEAASHCVITTQSRICSVCTDDTHCSHIPGKNKCVINSGCVAAVSASFKIVLSKTDTPDTYLATFPLEFVVNQNVEQNTVIKLVDIDPSTYSYSLSKVSDTVYQIRIIATASIPKTTLQLFYTYPSSTSNIYNAEISTKRIPYIPPSQRDAVETMQTIGSVVISTITGAAGPVLVLAGNPAIFWALINMIQLFYYLIFINVNYPANVQFFLKIFTIADFDFIPSPLTWFDPAIEGMSLPVPARFEEYDINGLFLNNAGNMLLIWCIVILIYIFAAFGNRFLNRPSRLARIAFATIVTWFEWGAMLRTLITSYPELTQASFLQIRVLDNESAIYTLSSIVGVIFAVYALVFPFMIIFIIKKFIQCKNKGAYKYETLTKEYDSKQVYPKYFASVFLVKWLIINLSLVFLHDFPYAEISVLTALIFVIIMLLARFKPYETLRDNRINIIIEALFLIMQILIAILIHDDQALKFSEDTRLNIGWALIGLGGLIVLTNMTVAISDMITTYKNGWKLIQKVIDKNRSDSKKRKTNPASYTSKAQNILDVSEQVTENVLALDTINADQTFEESLDQSSPMKRRIIRAPGGLTESEHFAHNMLTIDALTQVRALEGGAIEKRPKPTPRNILDASELIINDLSVIETSIKDQTAGESLEYGSLMKRRKYQLEDVLDMPQKKQLVIETNMTFEPLEQMSGLDTLLKRRKIDKSDLS